MTVQKPLPETSQTFTQPNARQRIIVVDGDPDVRRVANAVLTCCGYQTDAAEDGEAAWHALLVNNYDLVITDYNMPKATGLDLIRKLRDADRAVPVIMITAHPPVEEFSRSPWLQPQVVMTKPYPVTKLLSAVKEVLRAANESREAIPPPPNWQSPLPIEARQ